jgi:hypothetical protein
VKLNVWNANECLTSLDEIIIVAMMMLPRMFLDCFGVIGLCVVSNCSCCILICHHRSRLYNSEVLSNRRLETVVFTTS